MNKKDQMLKVEETAKCYHIPSMPNYARRPKNAIFLNPSNSWAHEMLKCKTCYELKSTGCQFITECEANKPRNNKAKRIDVVDLSSGREFEIIYKNENDQEIKAYRESGVIPIIVEPMKCSVCAEIYPKRTKSLICQVCKDAQNQKNL
jgi:hypothetical protein